jgi:ubiquinone/menaquinone biosynthesis C-methylase UbiE/pimeloyl-ACP methyl ester carboxylesterase
MMRRLDRVASETLSALHRQSIEDPKVVRATLERAAACSAVLQAGIDRRNEPRSATIIRLEGDALLLAVDNIADHRGKQLFVNFELDGVGYFLACSVLSEVSSRRLRVTIPRAIYRAERRDLGRAASRNHETVVIEIPANGRALTAEVADRTRHGLSVVVPDRVASALPREISFRNADATVSLFGRVRHRTPENSRPGWTRIGLSASSVPTQELIAVERLEDALPRSRAIGDALQLASAGMERLVRTMGLKGARSPEPSVVEYQNERGELIRALLNTWGDGRGTAVIIPPAWGRTKETMLPLALTLVETFKRVGQPITVLRYDGTNRRGESFIDPGFRGVGDEYLRFTFSQAARDISAAVDYLTRQEEQAPARLILVTFSLAAVEARHALASESRIDGWVSVVGMADLQSALRTISGGIDYGSGLLQGVRFGRHELVGVVADMDHTGLDAIKSGMGFLEDVRRDMALIEIPITWIHGRYDAWMDLSRVVETMSCGRTDNRRILEVPTGHQLRSGPKALATFRLIAEEVTEMALGVRRRGVVPRLSRIVDARAAELNRLPQAEDDVRGFWADYLLGRSRLLGLELLAATAAYRNFMETQIGLLHLEKGQRVADLGAGTGEFVISLTRGVNPRELFVFEFDFIRDALLRAREHHGPGGGNVVAAQCLCDLDFRREEVIPVSTASLDAVMLSLVISYVSNPGTLLREIYRVLKPGGRVVVSSMVRDADGMMLFHDGLLEYATAEARLSLGGETRNSFESVVRDFLNDGSKLFDLEERGRFRFWDERELRLAMGGAGFAGIESRLSFGDPAQAVIVSAVRP